MILYCLERFAPVDPRPKVYGVEFEVVEGIHAAVQVTSEPVFFFVSL